MSMRRSFQFVVREGEKKWSELNCPVLGLIGLVNGFKCAINIKYETTDLHDERSREGDRERGSDWGQKM